MRPFSLLGAWLFIAACQSLQMPMRDVYAPKNQKDYLWRLSSYAKNSSIGVSPLITTYRQNWGRILYSECKNVPSDSSYYVIHAQRGCSPIPLFLRTVGRLLREHELYFAASEPPILWNGRLVWVDLNLSCHEVL